VCLPAPAEKRGRPGLNPGSTSPSSAELGRARPSGSACPAAHLRRPQGRFREGSGKVQGSAPPAAAVVSVLWDNLSEWAVAESAVAAAAVAALGRDGLGSVEAEPAGAAAAQCVGEVATLEAEAEASARPVASALPSRLESTAATRRSRTAVTVMTHVCGYTAVWLRGWLRRWLHGGGYTAADAPVKPLADAATLGSTGRSGSGSAALALRREAQEEGTVPAKLGRGVKPKRRARYLPN
jgi:hypothetical protein